MQSKKGIKLIFNLRDSLLRLYPLLYIKFVRKLTALIYSFGFRLLYNFPIQYEKVL